MLNKESKQSSGSNLIYEFEKRTKLLKEFEIDTSGFGLLLTFDLYDSILEHLSKTSKFFYDRNIPFLYKDFSGVTTQQVITEKCEIWQKIRITGLSGYYQAKGWIHDVEPEKDKLYVLNKYNLKE
jgi:hypothetical protein